MGNASLLMDQKLPAQLSLLRQKANMIIIDGPALLNGAEASVLASMVDGVIMVVDIRHSKVPVLLRAKEVISSLGLVRVGVILNYLPRRHSNQFYASILPESKLPHMEMPIQQVKWNTPSNGSTPNIAGTPSNGGTPGTPGTGEKSLFSYLLQPHQR